MESLPTFAFRHATTEFAKATWMRSCARQLDDHLRHRNCQPHQKKQRRDALSIHMNILSNNTSQPDTLLTADESDNQARSGKAPEKLTLANVG